MRRRIIHFLTITLLLFGANLVVTQTPSQVRITVGTLESFTKKQIEFAIAAINKEKGNQKKIVSDRIIKDIRRRKVDFPLTAENEAFLRNKGASNELIEVIRETSIKSNEDYDEQFEIALEEGNTARDERNYVKAENAYRRAQSIKPQDSRAIYGLGNIYADQQRWEEAEKAYRTAIQIEPNNFYTYIALSYVLSQPIAVGNISERYAEAEILARKAIQLDLENPIAYDQLGAALELRGIINEETENAYRKAIQIDPNFALAYAHLGRFLRRTGRVGESSEAYRQAIKLSNDVPMMIMVAEVMQSQQRFTESEQLLRRALQTDTKNPTALFLLGRALTAKGSYDEAEKVLKKGLEVSPNNFVAYTLLSSLYTRQSNFIEAEKSLFKALQVASASEKKRLAQDFETLADGLMRVGNKADAIRLYKQAITLDSKRTGLNEKLSKAQGI